MTRGDESVRRAKDAVLAEHRALREILKRMRNSETLRHIPVIILTSSTDADTMKPLIDNEAWIEAFNVYKSTGQYGPPEELNHDIGDTRALVQAGRRDQHHRDRLPGRL